MAKIAGNFLLPNETLLHVCQSDLYVYLCHIKESIV